MRLTPTELEQILYDAAECSCQHCQRVRRMWEHVKAVERENAILKGEPRGSPLSLTESFQRIADIVGDDFDWDAAQEVIDAGREP